MAAWTDSTLVKRCYRPNYIGLWPQLNCLTGNGEPLWGLEGIDGLRGRWELLNVLGRWGLVEEGEII